MKKFFLALVLILSMLPTALCLAADPVITSDSRTFNPFTGVYDLKGNVFVQFPANNTLLTIKGDTTQVCIYTMEIHGQGNISLTFDNLNFNCDKVDVYNSNKTAFVSGNLNFADTGIVITADTGSYSWDSKLAAFHGNVKVNGQPHDGDVAYNVITKKIVS